MHPSPNPNCFDRVGTTHLDTLKLHIARDPGSNPALGRVLVFPHFTHKHHPLHSKLAFLQFVSVDYRRRHGEAESLFPLIKMLYIHTRPGKVEIFTYGSIIISTVQWSNNKYQINGPSFKDLACLRICTGGTVNKKAIPKWNCSN